MANEINLTLRGTVANGNFTYTFSQQDNVTQSAVAAQGGVAIVGTSEEDLTITDVATLGYAFFTNLDDTNFITFGPKSAGSMVAFGKLKPGESAVVRLATGITLRWVADTDPVKVSYEILGD